MSAPMVGLQGASGLNRALKLRSSEEVLCEVSGERVLPLDKGLKDHVLHRRGFRGTWARRIPRRLHVDLALCDEAETGDPLVGQVRPGGAGCPLDGAPLAEVEWSA